MIEVKLDKARKLKFDNNALIEIEEKLGVSVMVLLQDSQRLISNKTITTLAWAGLLHKDNLTFKEVVEIIPLDRLVEVMELIVGEVTKAYGFGDKEPSKGKKT